jgi:hypothetical protein
MNMSKSGKGAYFCNIFANNFFLKFFCKTCSTDLKSAWNSAFFDTFLDFFNRNLFLGHISWSIFFITKIIKRTTIKPFLW